MTSHDPYSFVSSLSSKLATRSRHVCFFLGAGVGRSCGLPDVSGLQDIVLNSLDQGVRTLLDHQLNNRNLEGALSRIRRIANLISGEETVDGLTADMARELDRSICQQIACALNFDAEHNDPVICLAAWLSRASYRLPVELFTVNYDLLLEDALEAMRVPYFDGFIGTLHASFHTELVESLPGSSAEALPSYFVRLWKLHGSLNWIWNENGQIVRIGQPAPKDLPAAIYPSDTKYDDSRRVPFLVLQDRFRRALNQPETLVLICGYSFGDEHLNELIFDAASRRERSEFLAFLYSDIPDALAERAQITPNLQVVARTEAIIGGVKADWKEPEDPLPDIWFDAQCQLPDFTVLAKYLARSTRHVHAQDNALRALLEQAMDQESGQGQEDADA